jgi:hypothetical protein
MDSTVGAIPAPRKRAPRHAVEVVSIHAPASDLSTEERVVSMTDAERILLAATLLNTHTTALLAGRSAEHGKRRLEAWQVIGVIFATLTGLILAGSAIYSTFFGLSHSILH